jgi:hypothetical protein
MFRMLLDIIAKDQTIYDAEAIGKMLADSDVDLADGDACLEVLIERGVRPWQVRCSLIEARVEAHNIRTSRLIIRRTLDNDSGAASLLLPFVLGGWTLLGLASEAHAAEHGPELADIAASAALAVVCVLTILALAIATIRQGPCR